MIPKVSDIFDSLPDIMYDMEIGFMRAGCHRLYDIFQIPDEVSINEQTRFEFSLQREVFSGDKWYHCYGSQAVTAPDGMIYDWWDRPLGRFYDKHFIADSGLNAILETIQVNNDIKYWAYTDKGYDRNTLIRCAAHGPPPPTEQQEHDNNIMSCSRVSVEWPSLW